MPAPPLREAVLHLGSGLGYPSGSFPDVRRLVVTPLVDTTSTVVTISGASAQNRTWRPFQSNSTSMPPETWNQWGWALWFPDDAVPDDSRGRMLIPAGEIRVHTKINKPSSGLTGNAEFVVRWVMWRWNPATDTATEITRASSALQSMALVSSNTVNVEPTATLLEDVIIERDETIVLTIGVISATVDNAVLGGSQSAQLILQLDSVANDGSRLDRSASSGFRVLLEESDDVPSIGVGVRMSSASVGLDRDGTGDGQYTKSLEAFRSMDSTADGEGVSEKSSQFYREGLGTADGVGTIERYLESTRTMLSDADGDGTMEKLAELARVYDSESIGAGVFNRIASLERLMSSVVDGTPALGSKSISKAPMAAIGDGIFESVRFILKSPFNSIAIGQGTRTLIMSKMFDSTSEAVGTIERLLIAMRVFDGTGDGTGTVERSVVFTRSLDGTAIGVFTDHDLLIKAPAYSLPEPTGGGTTIIQRPIYIFDD